MWHEDAAPRLSSRAQRSTSAAKWCAADPGPKYPSMRKWARQGYMDPGSRALRRSAGMTVESPFAMSAPPVRRNRKLRNGFGAEAWQGGEAWLCQGARVGGQML